MQRICTDREVWNVGLVRIICSNRVHPQIDFNVSKIELRNNPIDAFEGLHNSLFNIYL